MEMIVKSLFHHKKMSVGILGVIFFLIVVIPSGSVVGQQVASPVQEPGNSPDQDISLREEPKAHTWTVPCEREDGTQGIFRVSSKVTDKESPLDLESTTETVDKVENPPSPNIKEPASAEDPKDEDPFGNPTLKCGRLLTLLAIFATADSQTH